MNSTSRPRICFIRHGETDWNAARRLQGQTDTLLNDKGRVQAARNGSMLRRLIGRGEDYDFVASPLSRTSETMEIVREAMGLPQQGYRRDDRLKEIHFGDWQGRFWYEVAAFDPAGHAARERDPWSWHPPGGESYAKLTERIAGWLGGVTSPSVVVSHGGVSRVLRGLVLGLQPAEVLALDVPQDRILVIEHGSVEWV